MQSTAKDLSSFSGHVLVCKALLRAAAGTDAATPPSELPSELPSAGSTSTLAPTSIGPSPRSCLVLMDEVGSSTDPAQGAALAQAMLEALVGGVGPGAGAGAGRQGDNGATSATSGGTTRVAVTTHHASLKGLATSDKRFEVAAMEYVDGRPSFKLK